jgi:predicted Fe-Mo cluster-binding NifX family protein
MACFLVSCDEEQAVMKLAIPRYQGRISPRFGFTEDILVADLDAKGEGHYEVIPMDRRFPFEIPELLARRGVGVLITGGINLHFQNLFRSRGIEVIWGLIGTPEAALKAYFAGKVVPGMGRCPAGRQRRRQRGGPSWG